MQFEKCLRCSAIETEKCAGPNFMAMSTKELIEWEVAYQKIHGITNAQVSEKSGIPLSTINGLKYRDDVRHDTIYKILKALIELKGGMWGGFPCPTAHEEQPVVVEHVVDDEKLQEHLQKEELLKEENYLLKKNYETNQEILQLVRSQVSIRNKVIISLSIALAIVIAALIIKLFFM